MTTEGQVIKFDPQGYIPRELLEVAERVRAGEHPTATVRTLLSWFFAKIRTRGTVRDVERALERSGLKTEPYFDYTYLGATVAFVPASQPGADGSAVSQSLELRKTPEDAFELSDSVASSLEVRLDPIYRIGRLEMANRPPVSVVPDATVKQVVTLMLKNDFSQLPVMTTEREVKGLFSWKSLGSRVSQQLPCDRVGDAMDDYCEVSADASLFKAIALIREHDCILVRDATKKITGVMTAYDISATFGQLAEPFLVLGEIENHIRSLVRGKFTRSELMLVRDPGDPERTIERVEDLTFGEYLHLLESPERWEKLGLHIDRVIFVKELDEVRIIRNDVMHFDPEGVDEDDLAKLRKFDAFLRLLQRLRKK